MCMGMSRRSVSLTRSLPPSAWPQSFAVRDLEGAREARASTGGELSAAQAHKLEAARSKLEATTHELTEIDTAIEAAGSECEAHEVSSRPHLRNSYSSWPVWYRLWLHGLSLLFLGRRGPRTPRRGLGRSRKACRYSRLSRLISPTSSSSCAWPSQRGPPTSKRVWQPWSWPETSLVSLTTYPGKWGTATVPQCAETQAQTVQWNICVSVSSGNTF